MDAGPSQRNVITNDEEEFVHLTAWTQPSNGSWKLSFAGDYNYETKTASVGCILRDNNAVFKSAFAGTSCSANSVTIAQLTAFCRAIEFAITEGVDYVQLEGNHPFVFRMNSCEILRTGSEVRALIHKCMYDLRHIRSVTFRKVKAYDNLAASWLARIALDHRLEMIWFDDPPREITQILTKDVIGRWIPLSLTLSDPSSSASEFR